MQASRHQHLDIQKLQAPLSANTEIATEKMAADVLLTINSGQSMYTARKEELDNFANKLTDVTHEYTNHPLLEVSLEQSRSDSAQSSQTLCKGVCIFLLFRASLSCQIYFMFICCNTCNIVNCLNSSLIAHLAALYRNQKYQ